MKKSHVLLLLLLTGSFLIPLFSHAQQKTYEPARGSEERKVHMDLLRTELTVKFNGQKLIFEAIGNFYKSNGTWSVIYAYVYQSGGRPVDFNNSIYKKDYEEGTMDSNGIFALFKKSNGKWSLITHADFPTDVPIGCWWKEYNAPRIIFGSAALDVNDCE